MRISPKHKLFHQSIKFFRPSASFIMKDLKTEWTAPSRLAARSYRAAPEGAIDNPALVRPNLPLPETRSQDHGAARPSTTSRNVGSSQSTPMPRDPGQNAKPLWVASHQPGAPVQKPGSTSRATPSPATEARSRPVKPVAQPIAATPFRAVGKSQTFESNSGFSSKSPGQPRARIDIGHGRRMLPLPASAATKSGASENHGNLRKVNILNAGPPPPTGPMAALEHDHAGGRNWNWSSRPNVGVDVAANPDFRLRGSNPDPPRSAVAGGQEDATSNAGSPATTIVGELWLETLSLRDWLQTYLSGELQRASHAPDGIEGSLA